MHVPRLRSIVAALIFCSCMSMFAQSSVNELGGASDAGQQVFDARRSASAKFDPTRVYAANEVMHQPSYPGAEAALLTHFTSTEGCAASVPSTTCSTTQVTVSFIVERDGTITAPTASCEACPLLEALALCRVKSMARWSPGEIREVPVRVRLSIPVRYELR